MKSITGFALGLAALVAVPAAFADNHDSTKTKSTTTTTSSESTATTPTTDTSESATATDPGMTSTPTTTTTSDSLNTNTNTGTYGVGGGPTAATTTATTTTTTNDFYVHEAEKEDDGRHVRSGLGLNVFGTAGDQETARFGLGGRLEYVTKIGLAFGGSFTQHFTSDRDRTAIRPLLAEVGWAIPVVKHVEIRPMVGLGYAFASASRSGDVNRPSDNNPNSTTSASVNTGGFDFAPGAKISYVARSFEIFTMPKYHVITGNNFAGIELGAGARF